jgi:hypothetical protein
MKVAHELVGLENLAPVDLGDVDIFLAAADEAQVRAWGYYFPLLHLYGRFRAHRLL